MAAGEDQPQPVVLDVLVFRPSASLALASIWRTSSSCEASKRARRRMPSIALKRPAETSQPRIGRQPIARPLLDCCRKGRVHRLLGDIEIAEQADQRGEDAPRVGAVDGVHHRARGMDRIFVHGRAASLFQTMSGETRLPQLFGKSIRFRQEHRASDCDAPAPRACKDLATSCTLVVQSS